MKINAIITGATGMVGEGVLIECLRHPDVEKILLINRRTSGFKDNKITEIVHADFFDLSSVENNLRGYNACFFCLGVSSVGMKEDAYTRVTYDLTLNFARTLIKYNPDMIFEYVSGVGTDSTEKGKSMWARVKGRTENDLMRLPFKKVYAIRPGFMQPTAGMKNALKAYSYVNWLFPMLKSVFPKHVSTLGQVGLGMIQAAIIQPEQKILGVRELVSLAESKPVR